MNNTKKLLETISTFTNKGNVSKLYYQIDENSTKLAKCSCGMVSESNSNLPFFKSNTTKEIDTYYCGCQGWD